MATGSKKVSDAAKPKAKAAAKAPAKTVEKVVEKKTAKAAPAPKAMKAPAAKADVKPPKKAVASKKAVPPAKPEQASVKPALNPAGAWHSRPDCAPSKASKQGNKKTGGTGIRCRLFFVGGTRLKRSPADLPKALQPSGTLPN